MKAFRPLAAVGVVAAATVLALTGRWPWRRLDVAAPLPVVPVFRHSADTLRRGETLGDLLTRQGLGEIDLVELFERAGLDPRRLRAGLVVRFRHAGTDTLPTDVTLRSGPEERLTARRVADAWSADRQPVRWTTSVVRIDGPIDNSLYEALDGGIADSLFDGGNRISLAWDLADVYAWSIDFNRDIQPGDRFAVLVERRVSEEGEVRPGAIVAADLQVGGRHQVAVRFRQEDGTVGYYDEAGRSLRRAFLRAPVEFRRISSQFSRSRFHPVLGIWRRHEGTDYAAGSGTPVLAAGDGTVRTAGRAGGYGNLVEIRHLNGITTRYGHLRGFARGIRAGSRVRQGDVIGFVGSTGLATAPHLHYEFRINGAARDSRRVDLGQGQPLDRALMPLFERERDRWLDGGSTLGTTGFEPTPQRP